MDSQIRRWRTSFQGAGGAEDLNIQVARVVVILLMKKLFTLAVTAMAMAAFATTTYAGSCGGCTSGGDKSKDKTEEGAQS